MKTDRCSLTVAVVAGLAFMAASVSACGGKERPAQDASTSAVATPTTPTSERDAKANETTVQISKTLRERCNLPETPQEAPAFDYDAATLRPRGKNVLEDVAACLRDGPLKGEVITIQVLRKRP